MPKDKLTVHMVVKNEDRFIYYAINAILPCVDKLIICDTGSSDQTVPIIKAIKSSKIVFNIQSITNSDDITAIRQDQLNKTETDWLWIIDGDEIYTQSLVNEILSIIEKEGRDLEGIVVGRYDLLGDIYHYQLESVGTYNLFGKKGHYVLRLLNKKNNPGLHVAGDYPYEGYYDNKNIEIIHHNPEKFRFTGRKLWHAMYLNRSTSGGNLADTFHRKKYKIERGHKLPEGIEFPQVFFDKKPDYIPTTAAKRSIYYELMASIITPIKMLKRKFKY